MGGLRLWTGITLAALTVGCGGAATHAATEAASSATTSSAEASAPHVSNPFTIVARYSATSLGLNNPRDLAVGPNGDVYVTDATDRVTQISPAGRVLRRWGGRGKRAGQFGFISADTRDPNAIDASIATGPNGDVYVSDSGNARVEVFSPTGAFIRQFGEAAAGSKGGFLLPYDLAVDSSGDAYVADDQLNVVEKYSPTGAFLWQIGGPGSTDPDLVGEFHLESVDRHGLIVTTSDSQDAIIYVDSHGRKVDLFRTTSDLPQGVGPCNVSLDSEGDAFVQSCPGLSSVGEPTSPPVQDALVFDHTHKLIGVWNNSPFMLSPRFGPNGEIFAVGFQHGGYCFRCMANVLLKLKVTLP